MTASLLPGTLFQEINIEAKQASEPNLTCLGKLFCFVLFLNDQARNLSIAKGSSG